jgi:cytidylate kinase
LKGKDLLHSRNITVSTHEIGQDEILVEGILRDERLCPVISSTEGIELPAGIVHHMTVEMILAVPTLEILSIRAAMPAHPFPECLEMCETVRQLEGLRLMSGYTAEVQRRLGKAKGCLHLTNLLLATGSAAVQGAWSFFKRKRKRPLSVTPRQAEDRASLVLDSCRVWRKDGPMAARLRRRIDQTAAAQEDGKRVGRKLVVTIDGPAGSGKSTVSRRLAERLSYLYLDTGALYRAVAWLAIQEGTKQDDDDALADLCRRARVSVKRVGGRVRYFSGGRDVSDLIRTEEVGLAASRISAVPAVRKALLPVQREAGKNGGIVAEGRDMGTVVFKSADVKFYLEASEEVRIQRRFKELAAKGENTEFSRVANDLSLRDRQDRERAAAPLKVPRGAVVIDTSALDVDQVLQRMLDEVERLGKSSA